MAKLKTPKNKTAKKTVTITDAFLENSRELDPSDRKIKVGLSYRIKLWIARLIKIEVAKKKQYIFRVKFKGLKLKVGDIILSQTGVFFAVAQIQQNRARIVNIYFLKDKPIPRGVFTLVEDKKNI